jgi:hypothetical protein
LFLATLLNLRSYTEAVETLYKCNTFSFKGAKGIIKFNASLTPYHWHSLRHIHLSTTFVAPKNRWMKTLQPENYDHWETACGALSSLEHLQTLYVDMIIWTWLKREGTTVADLDIASLLFILGQLKRAKALSFQVGLNFEIPAVVKEGLGDDAPFEIVVRDIPYDHAFHI